DHVLRSCSSHSLRPNFIYILSDIAAATDIYTLSLHDALPISRLSLRRLPGAGQAEENRRGRRRAAHVVRRVAWGHWRLEPRRRRDWKSTRPNSSHVATSHAVLCLKKQRDESSACWVGGASSTR